MAIIPREGVFATLSPMILIQSSPKSSESLRTNERTNERNKNARKFKLRFGTHLGLERSGHPPARSTDTRRSHVLAQSKLLLIDVNSSSHPAAPRRAESSRGCEAEVGGIDTKRCTLGLIVELNASNTWFQPASRPPAGRKLLEGMAKTTRRCNGNSKIILTRSAVLVVGRHRQVKPVTRT